ncbi:MAG: beta-ketoacyl-[acyl-carrier-protein] synthase family protein [Rhodobacteraceae bacterium]|nr:beta-ketoacyl-[acyl-carrier-protein] synthase family protein [Paracoccaceae bacterium]
MTRKRVVVTGQGTINPLGASVADTWDAMAAGVCAIGPLEIDDLERLSIRIGGQVRDYDPGDHFSRQQLALYDRFTQFALIAADEALDDAGLDLDSEQGLASGVVIGTAGGGLNTWDSSYRAVYADGKNRVHPFVVPKLMNNAAASHISMTYGLRGPSFSVSTACSSSNHAIGLAFSMIRDGMSTIMLTGGSESMLCFGGIKAWEGLRVMSCEACRPFSADRSGMVQGEGAAVFVLEEYMHARDRGATILAEICGFSMTSDAGDIVMPSTDGAARAMQGALDDAGLAADAIQYINAHGTGTAANDRTECRAIREVFGSNAKQVMLSSTKSMHGHLIGGTGAVEMLACTLALNRGIIAPTLGYQVPDPECDLDIVPNTARKADVTCTMSNAFAFGGLNAVLVLKAGS